MSGEAANGLGWAAGSLNRVTQYSDIWSSLPGDSEGLYVFTSGGFFSQKEAPADVAMGPVREDVALLPVVCRYTKSDTLAGLTCEVLFHSYLSHSAKEMKRLLAAAEAMNRAFDLGYLPKEGAMATPLGRRAALLLTLAGLLEYPADQNAMDSGPWRSRRSISRTSRAASSAGASPRRITMPPTTTDRAAGSGSSSARVRRTWQAISPAPDPAAFARLSDPDETIGRALPIAV